MSRLSRICTYFLLITTWSYCSNPLGSPLFLDGDLTFVFTPDGNNPVDVGTDYPYFPVVRNQNSYTPLRNFLFNQSLFSATISNDTSSNKKVYGYRVTEKSARLKVIFFNLVTSITWTEKSESLILSSSMLFQQDLVFGYIRAHQDLLCLSSCQVFRHHKTRLVLGQRRINSIYSVFNL